MSFNFALTRLLRSARWPRGEWVIIDVLLAFELYWFANSCTEHTVLQFDFDCNPRIKIHRTKFVVRSSSTLAYSGLLIRFFSSFFRLLEFLSSIARITNPIHFIELRILFLLPTRYWVRYTRWARLKQFQFQFIFFEFLIWIALHPHNHKHPRPQHAHTRYDHYFKMICKLLCSTDCFVPIEFVSFSICNEHTHSYTNTIPKPKWEKLNRTRNPHSRCLPLSTDAIYAMEICLSTISFGRSKCEWRNENKFSRCCSTIVNLLTILYTFDLPFPPKTV